MTRRLVAGQTPPRSPNAVRVNARPQAPRQPRLFDLPDGGGPVVVPGYGRGRTTTFRTERAAVEEMRSLAAQALESRRKGERLLDLVEQHPNHPRVTEAVETAGRYGWEEESCIWLAARTWTALSSETRIRLAVEGWPGHPDVGANGCRDQLQGWIEHGEVPHEEAPF